MIAGRLPGRTDNEIKNYWNTHIRRKLLNRGIDPSTHRPLYEASSDVATDELKGVAARRLRREEEKSSSEELSSREQRCPDLNLDLSISPPYEEEIPPRDNSPEALEGESEPCFNCRIGLQKSKGCSCKSFLGLTMGFLDYRSLEMKL